MTLSHYIPENVKAVCPKCRLPYEQAPAYPTRCPGCGTRFGVYLFDPPEKPLDQPEVAMPEDVTCAFHPGKKAVEVCDGTGSYICALCAIPIGTKTYSADFINNGGLKNAEGTDAFERTLPRPDNAAIVCAVLALLTSCTIFVTPILVVISVIFYFRHLKARRDNTLYRRVSNQLTTTLLPIFYILTLLVFVGIIMAVILDY